MTGAAAWQPLRDGLLGLLLVQLSQPLAPLSLAESSQPWMARGEGGLPLALLVVVLPPQPLAPLVVVLAVALVHCLSWLCEQAARSTGCRATGVGTNTCEHVREYVCQ